MRYRTLGRTGLKVSLMSYGSGGPSRLGQNTGLSEQEQDGLIRRCLDLGINLFDSSTNYGDSEAILGRALEGVSRESYILATKWGPARRDEVKDDPLALIDSVEQSLSRLRTDHIDVMQFHGVLPAHYSTVVDRFYPTMAKLREQGKIRFVGLSEMFFSDPSHQTPTTALRTHPELWDTIMLKYGILNQYAAKEVLPLAQQHDVGILNMASVRVKLTRPDELEELIAEWKRDGLISEDCLPGERPLDGLIRDGVDSVISAGYKFAAAHPAISTVLTGTSSMEHLERNAAALENPTLPEADIQRLRALFGDLAEGA